MGKTILGGITIKQISFRIKSILYFKKISVINFEVLVVAECIRTTENIKSDSLIKFITTNRVKKNDIITGLYSCLKDKKLGEIIYLPNCQVEHQKDIKEYIRFLNSILGKYFSKENLKKLYNKYEMRCLSYLSDCGELPQEFKIDSSQRYIIRDIARRNIEFENLWFVFNIMSDNVIDAKKIMSASLAFNQDTILKNPYLLVRYGFEICQIDEQIFPGCTPPIRSFYLAEKFSIDDSYLDEDKKRELIKKRNLMAVYQYLQHRFRKFGDICICFRNEEIVNYINSLNKKVQIKNINLTDIIDDVLGKELFVYENNSLYLKENYETESFIVENIKSRLKQSRDHINVSLRDNLSKCQNKAIDMALNSAVSIITGGPGTGKTYTIINLVQAIRNLNLTVRVLSPTGRVANNIGKELGQTDVQCSTVHKALGLLPFKYKGNLYDIVEDYVIIDESSMIDISLFKYLLAHISLTSTIVLVGDNNQLLPIGGGQVFRELTHTIIPQVRLTNTFRQENNNSIFRNSWAITQGCNVTDLVLDENFYYIDNKNVNIVNVTMKVIQTFITQRDAHIHDIMILAPNKTIVDRLNRKIQKLYNKENIFVTVNQKIFKINDKVVQTCNDYEKKIFNGNVGIIREIENNQIFINFGELRVAYSKAQIGNLELAYATTIHKSQGSEAQYVFVVIDKNSKNMLNMNLIYTAITRAKECCVLIGASEDINLAFSKSAENNGNSNIIKLINDGCI